jgi:hypothetical protein
MTKPALHALPRFISERIAAQQAMHTAQESAIPKPEQRGDKYETGRAMAQERAQPQRRPAAPGPAAAGRAGPHQPPAGCDVVRPGALVHTSLGWFYTQHQRGRLVWRRRGSFCRVGGAPVAVALLGGGPGRARFNGKAVQVLAVA